MRKYKYIIISVAVVITSLLILKVRNASADVMEYMPVSNKIVVLDAGHGGIDPGAMNKDKTILEKDINLEITKKLRDLIEASGGTVIMTRDKDVSLYEEDGNKTTRQKYNENLRNRKKIIDESDADIFVSIHLNAFEQSKYYGAQTFYPAGKEDDKQLATYIQGELKRVVDKTNNRKIKSTNDIYLIKDNDYRIIINLLRKLEGKLIIKDNNIIISLYQKVSNNLKLSNEVNNKKVRKINSNNKKYY